MVDLHHLIALEGFEVDIKTPQPVQMLEYLVSGVAQWFAVMLLVAKC